MASSSEGRRLPVIADTSFLMIPGMFRVDLFGELDRLLDGSYELLVPSPVVKELERISEQGKPKERTAAKLGLSLVKRGSVVNVEGEADESIVKLAVERKCLVGTSDFNLRKRLRASRIGVIYLRGKSHLALNGQLR
ncbi:MAG: PIN domain-containing protein [Candidatus Hadarchaeum sp.]|uniref:type II toxin-antitoxin system VapC family toxin n=1 Tax=Candidatus Hadarchaeum sp. TaxID=2883567 RepID=UPI003D0F4C07